MLKIRKLTTLAAVAALAFGLAACGGDSDTAEGPMTGPDPALTAAQTAAMAAATAAKKAADEAKAAVEAQMANEAADEVSFALAQDAARRAQEAADAAAEANTAAQAATTVAAAQTQRNIALSAQATAEDEQTKAETAAGRVQIAQGRIEADNMEKEAVRVAREAASTAAGLARTAATDAQTAANKVAELLGADHAQAVQAQEVANAADAAADTAEAARDMANEDGISSADAKVHQETAETQQGEAEDQREAAVELQREAQIAANEGDDRVGDQLASDLKTERDKATEAMNDAKTASDNAADAAKAAADALENHATLQTADLAAVNARAHAANAKSAAGQAMAEYEKAKTESEAAAMAETVPEAVAARIKAETARDDAMKYEGMAGNSRDDTVEAASMELKIDGTMKSVGDTTLDAEAVSSIVTTDGDTVNTGLQAENLLPSETVAASTGLSAQAADSTADPAVTYRAPTAGAAARTLTLGKTVDSADDTARLMIVTSYSGSKTVKVFAYAEADPAANSVAANRTGTKAGYVSSDPTAVATTNDVRLSAAGTYYQAGAAADADGLANTDVVGAEAKGMTVYSYVNDQGNTDPTDDVTVYLVEDSSRTEGTLTTTVYRLVDILNDAINHDGDPDTPTITPEFTAKIPEATEYKHIHFGVWAALGAAEKDGSQKIADLGIGFVQGIGDGLTGTDMPNNGSANYSGNWVATVQAMDEDGDGAISLTRDTAFLDADFGKGEIDVTLSNLATLEGKIDRNTFSGTDATATGGGLDTEADFEGSFSGGFYGSKAAEAGGIFDFASDDGDNEGGAFRGAFGADRDAD